MPEVSSTLALNGFHEASAGPVAGRYSVPADELFPPAYVQAALHLDDFDAMLLAAGLDINLASLADLTLEEDARWTKLIRERSRFTSWEELLADAASAWVGRVLLGEASRPNPPSTSARTTDEPASPAEGDPNQRPGNPDPWDHGDRVEPLPLADRSEDFASPPATPSSDLAQASTLSGGSSPEWIDSAGGTPPEAMEEAIDPDLAGPGQQDGLPGRLRITHRGIDYLERYLARLVPGDAMQEMIQRWREIADGKVPLTPSDLPFYHLVLRVSVRDRSNDVRGGRPVHDPESEGRPGRSNGGRDGVG